MDQEKNARKEARLRRATEQLYGDTRLRDELTDEQAEQLLAWANKHVEQEVERTLNLPDEDAQAALEGQLQAVKSVARQVSQITGELPGAPRGRIHEHLLNLVDALCEVDPRAVHINDMIALEQLAGQRETLNSEQVFEKLMDIIHMENEEE